MSREEAAAFVDTFEAAIAARDWERVRRAFLSGAPVVFQVSTDPTPKEITPEEWIRWLVSPRDRLGYVRKRESYDLEPRGDGMLVETLVVERALAPGGRIELSTKESIYVTRYQGAIGIGVLGVLVNPERVRPLDGELDQGDLAD